MAYNSANSDERPNQNRDERPINREIIHGDFPPEVNFFCKKKMKKYEKK